MKVSIITPCYNAAPYIATTIASVQQQTLSDWEMIIVDDGSTDNSADIVTRISQEDNRIKLIQKENGGSASARNLGLTIATGEYIQFLDADDTIAPDKLARQTALMDREYLDLSYTDFRIVDADGTTLPLLKGYRFNLYKLLVGWGPLGTIPPHAFLYKHEFIRKNHICFTTEIREREDWDFHIKTFSCAPRVQRIKEYCGAYYFRCPTGKTTNGSLSKLTQGTLKYLIYKIHTTKGFRKLLLYIRLSFEMITLGLGMARKQIDIQQLKSKVNLSKVTIALAIALTPISIILYACYWLRVHTELRKAKTAKSKYESTTK